MSKRRDEVHEQFMELLESVRPNPGAERLFKEVIIRRWNEEYKVAVEMARRSESKLRQLEEKKSKLIDLFINGDLTTNEKNVKMAQIDTEIAMLHVGTAEAGENVRDREEIVDKAMLFMSNPGLFWNIADVSIKRRVQQVVFP